MKIVGHRRQESSKINVAIKLLHRKMQIIKHTRFYRCGPFWCDKRCSKLPPPTSTDLIIQTLLISTRISAWAKPSLLLFVLLLRKRLPGLALVKMRQVQLYSRTCYRASYFPNSATPGLLTSWLPNLRKSWYPYILNSWSPYLLISGTPDFLNAWSLDLLNPDLNISQTTLLQFS